MQQQNNHFDEFDINLSIFDAEGGDPELQQAIEDENVLDMIAEEQRQLQPMIDAAVQQAAFDRECIRVIEEAEYPLLRLIRLNRIQYGKVKRGLQQMEAPPLEEWPRWYQEQLLLPHRKNKARFKIMLSLTMFKNADIARRFVIHIDEHLDKNALYRLKWLAELVESGRIHGPEYGKYWYYDFRWCCEVPFNKHYLRMNPRKYYQPTEEERADLERRFLACSEAEREQWLEQLRNHNQIL